VNSLDWHTARRVAATARAALPVVSARLDEAVGSTLGEPLTARSDLPPFPSAAMDGFAVAGHGPWLISDDAHVAGREEPAPLEPGHAVAIATGAVLPPGATSVLRSELAVVEGALHGSRLFTRDPLTNLPDESSPAPPVGTDIRAQGEECAAGDHLVAAGVVVTPGMVGLAAAAGYDTISVIPSPVIGVFVMGDELLDRGLPRPGRVRDALGPLLPPWLAGLGARVNPPIRVPDSLEAVLAEIDDAQVDVIITTGSTASGPVDHLHSAVDSLRARWLVDGVAVRPGHPMLMAELRDGRILVGLPGNPLAAVSGLVTLAAPLIAAMRGSPEPLAQGIEAVLLDDVTAHPHDTRLVPVSIEPGEVTHLARPHLHAGPAMLRGLAQSDGFAVITPGSGSRGTSVQVLPNPPIV
jgi:molybdopterin molybdotransferase